MRHQTISRRGFCAAAVATAVGGRFLHAAEPEGNKPAVAAGRLDWLDEIQQPPENRPDGIKPLAPLLEDGSGNRIATVDGWEARRAELLKAWSEFLGPMPAPRTKLPEIEVLAEDRDAGVQRQLIRYEAEPGEAVEAYLLRPLEKSAERRPGVVVLHSTVNHSIRQPAGVEGVPEKAFGLRLARRGWVTLSPRNYLWPETGRIAAQQEAERFLQRHPQSKGMVRMLHDALLATDILAAQPDVDPARLGCVGHSLGAKEVLYHAAFDSRIRAAVSSEGGIGPTFSNWDAPWYLGPAIKQPDFALDHHQLLAAAAPRAFLLVGGDSADGDQSWPYIEATLPVYRLYGEPARLGLFNHRQGHAVPTVAEQRIEQWLDAFL